MKKYWILVSLIFYLLFMIGLQAGGKPEKTAVSLTISGDEWLQGHFDSTFYSKERGGLTLTPATFAKSWELKLPGTVILDVVTDNDGYAYAAGATRTDEGWGEWLGAFDLRRHTIIWRSPTPTGFLAKWAQAVAIDRWDNGTLIVTGWSGDSVLLSAFTPRGRILWRRELTISGKSAIGLDVLAWGNIAYVIGTAQDQRRPYGFLMKCDTNGAVIWAHLYDRFKSLTNLTHYKGSLVCLAANGDKNSLVAFNDKGEILWQVELPANMEPKKVINGETGLFVVCSEMLNGRGQAITVFALEAGKLLKKVVEYPVNGFTDRAGAFDGQGSLWLGGWKDNSGILLRWDSNWNLVQEKTLSWGDSSRVQGIANFPDGWMIVGMAGSNETSRSYVSVWQAKQERMPSGTYISRIHDWGTPVELSSLRIQVEGLDLGKVQITLETSQDGFANVANRREWTIVGIVQELKVKQMSACRYSRIVVHLEGGTRGAPVVKEIRLTGQPWESTASQSRPRPEEHNQSPSVTLIKPLNGSTEVSWKEVDYRWRISDPDGGTVTCYMYCEADDSNPLHLIDTLTGVTDSTLEKRYPCEPATTYYWKVVIKDKQGHVVESPVWQFTTTHPPNKPSIPSPVDGATGVAASGKLCWDGGDPDGGSVSYKIYLDTNPLPAALLGTFSSEFSSGGGRQCISYKNLEKGVTYYWKVEAKDSYGTVSGPVWSFTTERPIAMSSSVGLAKRTIFRFALKEGANPPYFWNFGDGHRGVGNPVEHVYAQPGIYRVTVSKGKGMGCIGGGEVSVYREIGSWFGLKLPVLGNNPHFSPGDFNGDERVDLVSWMPGRRSIYLLEGSGNGRFHLSSNRLLPLPLTTLQVVDFDGDNLDDVLGFNLDKNKVWLLRGSPDGLLSMEQPISIPAHIVYPLWSRKGLVCLCLDKRGQRVICWVRFEGGQLTSHLSPVGKSLPTVVTLDLNSNGLPEQCLLGKHGGWVVWDTPNQQAVHSPLPGRILAVGEWDGDGVEDVLVRNDKEIELWSLAKGRLTALAPAGTGRWAMLDCNGDGIDEVVNLTSLGKATFYFSKPELEQLTVPLPLIPDGYTTIEVNNDLKEGLLLYLTNGRSIVFRLNGP